jgi:transcriptional regulator with XRE-family HTH domain
MPSSIIPAQIRAARGLLSWSQEELAQAAKIGLSTLRDVETGKRDPTEESSAALRSALEGAGVKFIDSNGDGPGVQLSRRRPYIIRKPTKVTADKLNQAYDSMLPFRVSWRNQKVIVFLPTSVLDDLDGTDHRSDAQFLAAFQRHEARILDRTAQAIDAKPVDANGHLRLQAGDFFD